MAVRFRIRKDFEKYMKFRGWTVTDVVKKMGYKKQQVSSTLSGKIEPTMNFLHRLCALTELRADELIETDFNSK